MVELMVVKTALGLVCILVGWLHVRQNSLEKRIQECVAKDDLEEMKAAMKQMVEIVTELRVENAKWQGLMQRALENE